MPPLNPLNFNVATAMIKMSVWAATKGIKDNRLNS